MGRPARIESGCSVPASNRGCARAFGSPGTDAAITRSLSERTSRRASPAARRGRQQLNVRISGESRRQKYRRACRRSSLALLRPFFGDSPMLTARTLLRRSALAASLSIVAGSAIISRAGALHAKPTPTSTVEPSSRWLKGLTAKHRQFFDAPAANGGIALVHVMNYYDTYNKAFGVKDADIDAVLTFYGGTTFYGLNDAVWAKYQLGEFLETNDPS